MNRIPTVDVTDVGSVGEERPIRRQYALPGSETDPRMSLVTFSEQLFPQSSRELVRSAYDPHFPVARWVRYPCGTNVLIPPGATPEIVESAYVDARLNLILSLVVPAGNA